MNWRHSSISPSDTTLNAIDEMVRQALRDVGGTGQDYKKLHSNTVTLCGFWWLQRNINGKTRRNEKTWLMPLVAIGAVIGGIVAGLIQSGVF